MFNKWIFPDSRYIWIAALSQLLHKRSSWRLAAIFVGISFAEGRKTITSWFRAASISQRYQSFYNFTGSIGRKTEIVSTILFEMTAQRTYNNTNIVLTSIDDSPTVRYGPKVAGAGIYRNLTPTPDGKKFIYGHVWVTLSTNARHKNFGTIGPPLLARLYVKAKDINNVGLSFKSKTEQAVELSKWAYQCCQNLGKELWVVTGGGFNRSSFLKPIIKTGTVVVTRLRKVAVLYAEMRQPAKRKRGRPHKYGKRVKLQNIVNDQKGWSKVKVFVYGKHQIKEVKLFKALYKPARCLVQVVVVRESKDCFRAILCTDLNACAAEILEAVADRYEIEQNFSDMKEIEGAGQQQVRTLASNIGAFHLNLWLVSLVELWAWDKPAKELCNRSDSPWDNAYRRPSHADKCAALRGEVLKRAFFVSSYNSHEIRRIHKQFYKLLKFVA